VFSLDLTNAAYIAAGTCVLAFVWFLVWYLKFNKKSE